MILENLNSIQCQTYHVNGLLQIIDRNKNNSNIKLCEILKVFTDEFKFDPTCSKFAFFNQNQLINSLYAFLCLPKEAFHDSIPRTHVSELDEKWGLEGQTKDIKLQTLTRHLRNSISHGKVVVNESLEFTFSDGNKIFTFNHMNLFKLINQISFFCIK